MHWAILHAKNIVRTCEFKGLSAHVHTQNSLSLSTHWAYMYQAFVLVDHMLEHFFYCQPLFFLRLQHQVNQFFCLKAIGLQLSSLEKRSVELGWTYQLVFVDVLAFGRSVKRSVVLRMAGDWMDVGVKDSHREVMPKDSQTLLQAPKERSFRPHTLD